MRPIIIIFISFLLTASCDTQLSSPEQFRIGLLYDLSKSAELNNVPLIQENHVTAMTNMVGQRGGEIAFLPVKANSYHQLIRLELEPMTHLKLKEKALLHQKQKEKIGRFKQTVIQSVNKGRTNQKTDIYGGLKKMDVFFKEPNTSTKKFLLIISDGYEDAHLFPNTKISDDVTVFLIGNRNEHFVKNLGDKVLEFENINSALKYIRNSSKEDKA